MDREFSKPLTELPRFLSTISMVSDDASTIVQKLVQAERKSPAWYDPARDLFISVLENGFTFDKAIAQATQLDDETKRTCAIEILLASEKFLKCDQFGRVGRFSSMNFTLPNGMNLPIAPILLRYLDPRRIMVLHFWRTPLSPRQLSAAGAVLKKVLLSDYPAYANCDLDFISVSRPEGASSRKFRCLDWRRIRPLPDSDLDAFWKQFIDGWTKYQLKQPRLIKRRQSNTLFG